MSQPPDPSSGRKTSDSLRSEAWAILTTPIHPRRRISEHLRAKLFAGFITAIPLFASIWVAVFVYGLITEYTTYPAKWIVNVVAGTPAGDKTAAIRGLIEVSPAVRGFLDYVVHPFLAVSIAVLIVYVLGLLGTFVIGRRLLAAGEHFISNLPLIKGIYGTTKQVIGVFRQGGGGSGFQRVVLVEFPRAGTWTVGFVTKTLTDTSANIRYVCVFIPMTPNPTSGFFQMFPEASVRNTDWTVDEGIKILLSGGLLAPDHLDFGAAHVPNEPAVPTVSPQ